MANNWSAQGSLPETGTGTLCSDCDVKHCTVSEISPTKFSLLGIRSALKLPLNGVCCTLSKRIGLFRLPPLEMSISKFGAEI